MASDASSSQRFSLSNSFPGAKVFQQNKKYVLIALVVFILGGLLYVYRGLFVAATVNGEPVSRLSVVQELEAQNGPQLLDQKITEILIAQEARKKSITVSDEEVDEELDSIASQLSEQGQDFDQLLSLQGLTREDIYERIRLQKMVEKIIGDEELEVTDEEVTKFIEDNQEFLPDQEEDQLRETITTQLRQEKIDQKSQELIARLREEADIQRFVDY